MTYLDVEKRVDTAEDGPLAKIFIEKDQKGKSSFSNYQKPENRGFTMVLYAFR
jgi:hypothetical protein